MIELRGSDERLQVVNRRSHSAWAKNKAWRTIALWANRFFRSTIFVSAGALLASLLTLGPQNFIIFSKQRIAWLLQYGRWGLAKRAAYTL